MRMARLPCHVRPIPKGQFDADLKSKSGHGGLLLMKQWERCIHTATWLAIGLWSRLPHLGRAHALYGDLSQIAHHP